MDLAPGLKGAALYPSSFSSYSHPGSSGSSLEHRSSIGSMNAAARFTLAARTEVEL